MAVLVKVNWVNGKWERQQVLGGRMTEFFICLYRAEITNKVHDDRAFYSDGDGFTGRISSLPLIHWLSDHLPPNHVWVLLPLSQASGSLRQPLAVSLNCLFCKCCSFKFFRLGPRGSPCPTTLSLSIVPSPRFFVASSPAFDSARSLGPCTAALHLL